jgi:hypothetical protein
MCHSLKIVIDSLNNLSMNASKDNLFIINPMDETEIFSPINIIAFSAFLVSVISIVISIMVFKSSQKFQILSVIPILTSFEDFSFRSKEGIGIKLISCGLGPAIIDEFKLLWNNVELNKKTRMTIINSLGIPDIEFYNVSKGSVIEKDSTKWMMRIPSVVFPMTEENVIRSTKIREIIKKNLTYEIVFKSINTADCEKYGCKYPFE